MQSSSHVHCTTLINVPLFVWFQKISIPPLPKGFAVLPPLPSGFSKIGPQNLSPPPPLWSFQNFRMHPLEILLSLIEVNREVVLLTRTPNFVIFMYFLLNCLTDKRIPYVNSFNALKSQTNFVSLMYFLLNSATDKTQLL